MSGEEGQNSQCETLTPRNQEIESDINERKWPGGDLLIKVNIAPRKPLRSKRTVTIEAKAQTAVKSPVFTENMIYAGAISIPTEIRKQSSYKLIDHRIGSAIVEERISILASTNQQ